MQADAATHTKTDNNPPQEIDTRQAASEILSRRGIDGEIVFSMVSGSTAYNLQREDGRSDIDFLAVYCAPPQDFWGLHQPQARVTSKPGQSPDIQVLEVASFCNALLNANPSIVEMLWADHMCWWERRLEGLSDEEARSKIRKWRAQYPPSLSSSPSTTSIDREEEPEGCWDYLRAHRRRFLTRELVRQYLGFARGQLQQVEAKPEVHGKKIYNALRLLREAKRVINGLEPLMWTEGEEKDFLMSVRRGEKPLETYVEYGRKLIMEIEAEKPWPRLEDHTDEAWLEAWLLVVRRNAYLQSDDFRHGNALRLSADLSGGLVFENFG